VYGTVATAPSDFLLAVLVAFTLVAVWNNIRSRKTEVRRPDISASGAS